LGGERAGFDAGRQEGLTQTPTTWLTLGCGERLRRAAGRVPDGAGGAEQPDGSRTRRRARQSLRDVAAACAVR
jgi:hypothetical protein